MLTSRSTRSQRSVRRPLLALTLAAGSLAAVSTAGSSIAAAPAGDAVDLGAGVTPTDVNLQDMVVGRHSTDSGFVGFTWTPTGGLQDIDGTIDAYAVNEAGQVTGNTPTGAYLYDGSLRTWNGYRSYGMNESGDLAGFKVGTNPYRTSPLPLDPAVRIGNHWTNLKVANVYSRGTRKGVYADLYVLSDINEAGYSVGRKSRSGLAGSASILIDPTYSSVTFLPIPSGGYAAAINDQNLIVGTTTTKISLDVYAHGYLYDLNADTVTDLGTLDGGLTSSAADVNNHNQVVGSSWLSTVMTSLSDPTLYHAYIWENGQMTDLNSRLPAGSNWLLTSATAINEDGDIVGVGLLNGESHGFLLPSGETPPPPNQPPVPVATASVTKGKAPLAVEFDASGSFDPDGDPLTYEWAFGDGSTATGATVSHELSKGRYTVVLTVTDNHNATATTEISIHAR